MFDVLFVDDDISLRYIILKMKIWNYSDFRIKKQAKNGQEALELLESYDFDLVITDIRMPIIDGLELLESIRERNIDVFVVLASTYSEFEYAKRGLQLGAIDYVIKPIREENLREVLMRTETLLIDKKEKELAQNKFVISQEKIDKWCNEIINLRTYEEKLLKEFYFELQNSDIKNENMYPEIMQEILSRIWEKMCELFTWLKNVIDIKVYLKTEILQNQFLETIKVLIYISEKYIFYKQDNFINKVCSIIASNICNNNVLEIISQELELSKDYISKLFKSKMEVTLIEYCTFIKIEYAKNILYNSNKKIYEISYFLGYSTVDYFTKLFKKYTGETPTTYRKQLAEKGI